jgi:hypothetical protein
MTSWGLIRLAGVSAALGGVLLLVTDVAGWFDIPTQQRAVLGPPGPRGFWAAAFLLALVLVVGGLVGLYARQAQRVGVLGFVGFAAAFSGTVLHLGTRRSHSVDGLGAAERKGGSGGTPRAGAVNF